MKKLNTNFKTFIMLIMLMTVIISGCNREKNEVPRLDSNTENPMIQIEMQDGGVMVFELYPEFAPETVENFVNLTETGFYDGLEFHRIIEGFMIQGGDPNGDGTGGSGQNIRGEFAENGFTQNTLRHTKGTISMARSNHPDSASSQFFIMHGDESFLDGKYAAFGRLIEGEETLDRLASIAVELNPLMGEVSKPQEDVVINRITVLESD